MFPLTPEQVALKDKVRALAEEHLRPLAEEIAESEGFPQAAFELFREAGFFKLCLPPEYGGQEAGALDMSLVISEIARISGACALLPFPTNAVIRCLALTASQEQKARWFPEFAQGDKMAAFCLTEPNYGSDAGSLMTRAERTGQEYVINGTKTFITLGQYADYYLVFVRTGPGARTAGVSAVVVEQGAPGLGFGKTEKKMGLGGSITQEVIFQNCRVPAGNLLLEEGLGWQILTGAANPMRLWGAASMSLGMAQGAFELAVEHARTRRASGHKISRYQSVQFMLADMAMKIEAARSLIWRTAVMIDSGELEGGGAEMFVSMGKAFASDMAMEVCTDAVQIFGRMGVTRGHPVERIFRDAKGVQIFDGANQVQRMIIARHILR
ncbi:MAG: acyl-CoA dehydrogenase family protein [Deltaproteobacteria bacterium]|nr:acyl-CoA dehydrogenase family protein [Deltaproteobacteria bacterium]